MNESLKEMGMTIEGEGDWDKEYLDNDVEIEIDKQSLKNMMSKLGKMSAQKLTPKQRSKRAKKAVEKRWENYKLKKEHE